MSVEVPKRLNFPTPEPSVAMSKATLDFQKDVSGIERVRRFFRLGGVEVAQRGIRRNYDLALARWNYEKAETDSEIEQFKEYETSQVKKALRERYGSAESTTLYIIDEDFRLRNKKNPNEATALKIYRGNLYLKKEGSPDTEREQAELEGFLKVENLLANPSTPISTKMMVMSPPSFREGSMYVKNFVDFYELIQLDGKRVVRMTRFASSASYGELTDIYLLSHPVRIDSTDKRNIYEIFNTMFAPEKEALEEDKIQQILRESKKRIQFFINVLCNPFASAESIALAFNAVLNGADLVWKQVKGLKEKMIENVSSWWKNLPTFRDVREEVDWLGRQKVEAFLAACGMSLGYTVGIGIKGIAELITKSIKGILRKFSGSDQYGSLEFDCQKCNKTNRRPRGQKVACCQHCSADVSC